MKTLTPEQDNINQVVKDVKYLIATGCNDETVQARIENFMKEVSEQEKRKAFEAGENYANDCRCGKCDYCTEVKDKDAPNCEEYLRL